MNTPGILIQMVTKVIENGSGLRSRGIFIGVQMAMAGALLAVTLSGCAAVQPGPAESPGPTDVPEAGSIAYVGLDENIYLIDPAGGSPHPITDDAAAGSSNLHRYQTPTWDPSSNALAFIELKAGESGVAEGLVHVLAQDASEAEVVFRDRENFPIYMDWSSRGSQLAILTSQAGESSLRLWIAGAQEMATEVDSGQPYYWDWSEQGEKLFAHVGGSAAANPAGARLSLVSMDSGDVADFSLEPAAFRAPDVRPGNGGAAVAAETDEGPALLLLDETGEMDQVLIGLDQAVAFSWSPAGDQLAYVEGSGAGPHAFGELSLLEVLEDGAVNRLDTGLGPVVAFFWSPESDQLAAFVVEAVEPRRDQLASSRSQMTEFMLRLVLVDAETGRWDDLARLQPTADWLSVVTYHDQYQRSSTIWSPSGDRLVYSSDRTSGEAGIYVIEAQPGAEPRLIARGNLAFWSFSEAIRLR
ncbi:MAG: hypothetical protein ACLFWD_03395 [Anaerolineales bacterium]